MIHMQVLFVLKRSYNEMHFQFSKKFLSNLADIIDNMNSDLFIEDRISDAKTFQNEKSPHVNLTIIIYISSIIIIFIS